MIDMLQIILSGQENMLKEMNQVSFRMDNVVDYIVASDFTKNQKKVMFILL